MSVTADETYSLLAAPRRRYVLATLLETERATAEELAVRIADCEAETTVEEATDEKRREVLITLVHNHLPRLADHGAVEYDARNGDVVRGNRFEEVRPAIEAVTPENECDPAAAIR